jgi:hypothetical protein
VVRILTSSDASSEYVFVSAEVAVHANGFAAQVECAGVQAGLELGMQPRARCDRQQIVHQRSHRRSLIVCAPVVLEAPTSIRGRKWAKRICVMPVVSAVATMIWRLLLERLDCFGGWIVRRVPASRLALTLTFIVIVTTFLWAPSGANRGTHTFHPLRLGVCWWRTKKKKQARGG